MLHQATESPGTLQRCSLPDPPVHVHSVNSCRGVCVCALQREPPEACTSERQAESGSRCQIQKVGHQLGVADTMAELLLSEVYQKCFLTPQPGCCQLPRGCFCNDNSSLVSRYCAVSAACCSLLLLCLSSAIPESTVHRGLAYSLHTNCLYMQLQDPPDMPHCINAGQDAPSIRLHVLHNSMLQGGLQC